MQTDTYDDTRTWNVTHKKLTDNCSCFAESKKVIITSP